MSTNQYETRQLLYRIGDNSILWRSPNGEQHEVSEFKRVEARTPISGQYCEGIERFGVSMNGCRFEGELCRASWCQGFFVSEKDNRRFRVFDYHNGSDMKSARLAARAACMEHQNLSTTVPQSPQSFTRCPITSGRCGGTGQNSRW